MQPILMIHNVHNSYINRNVKEFNLIGIKREFILPLFYWLLILYIKSQIQYTYLIIKQETPKSLFISPWSICVFNNGHSNIIMIIDKNRITDENFWDFFILYCWSFSLFSFSLSYLVFAQNIKKGKINILNSRAILRVY